MAPKFPPLDEFNAGRATPAWGTRRVWKGIPYPFKPEAATEADAASLAITRTVDWMLVLMTAAAAVAGEAAELDAREVETVLDVEFEDGSAEVETALEVEFEDGRVEVV